ncbi:DUF4097 family beta strand repeat-containing protein [Tenacibaculum amylolyticum]|uniref:DUF4097 family beta strand repeat-containing protein n=1 Tax=Tenacibaculum amylolyticum TaxID=104269 RepID=UPI0038933BF5
MIRTFLIIGLLLLNCNLIAQEKVVKNHKANGIENVSVEVKFAKNIEIKNWNKNEISVEAIPNLNNNKDNKYFSLKEDKLGDTYIIKSDYGDYFEKRKIEYSKSKKGDCYNNYEMYVNYTIYVPKNMQLKVKSISGNVDALSYTGNLTLDLISGNITVKKHSKNMKLKTISGDIDVAVSDAKFKAETLTGAVYSDLDIDFDKNKEKFHMGSKIYGTVKNGLASLDLKTISGNIFLRKQ